MMSTKVGDYLHLQEVDYLCVDKHLGCKG